MKYKFSYKDSQDNPHTRYYTALNAGTASEMFKASVDHSIKDSVFIEVVEYLEGSSWKRLEMSPIGWPLDNIPTSQV
jgi:hypothetical protein